MSELAELLVIPESLPFSLCLPAWSSQPRRRAILFDDRSAQMNAWKRETTSLETGQSVEVCGLMLPVQAGKAGECVRFVLHPNWETGRGPDAIYSKPFVI